MLRSVVFFAAKGVIRDVVTNNISVFSILEAIQNEVSPFFVQELGVFAMWRRDPGDPSTYELEFVIRNNDSRFNAMPVKVNFGEGLAHRTTINVSGVVVHEAGKLTFEFRHGEDVVASYAIDVSIQPPAAPAPPAAG